MNYYSIRFGFFFATVATLYFIAPRAWRIPILLSASALFYMAYVPQYIFILLALISIDYCAGLAIERAASRHRKRTWLALSIAANLGLMCTFKYLPTLLGVSLGIMPLGLSFHTFQAMAYTIEVYRGRQAAERSFWVYALYVLFFPQIAAGPIERPQSLLTQFRKAPDFRYSNVVSGLQLMAWGFFQKYVVADQIGPLVDSVYHSSTQFSGPIIAFTAICFSFQILCDFSGYCDIATGVAEVMGFRLTRNFKRPFSADSMAEYWKRWHISLSYWMRDYVFFPLCGIRARTFRICTAIMVVFLANGIWHGASWTYLISGFLHGIYRVTELLAGRAISRAGWALNPVWERPVRVLRIMLVFSLITFAFIFFRATSLSQSIEIVRHLFSGWWEVTKPTVLAGEFAKTGRRLARLPFTVALIGVVQLVHFLQASGPLRPRIATQPSWLRWGIYYAGVASLFVFADQSGSAFIYFRF